MKRFLSLLLIAVLCISMFSACSSSEPAKPESSDEKSTSTEETTKDTGKEEEKSTDKAEKKGLRVAMHNAVNNNGWRVRFEAQLQEVADKYIKEGIISQYSTFCSNNDPSTQSQQIEQTINEGYDIILVNPISGTGLDPIIDKALEKGITYVNVDCLYESDRIVNITTDQEEWARINAEFVCENLNGKGKVVIFNGLDGNSASEIRRKVYHEVLDKYSDIEVVKELAHGWSQTESKKLMSQLIASGVEFDAILTQEAALGQLQAIEEAGRPWPKAITSDEEVGYLRKLAEINKDELVLPFIIVENPPGIGATALKFAVRLAQGKELKDGVTTDPYNAIYVKPQFIVTYENMEEALEMTKDLPDTEFISTYLSDEQVDEYFK